MWQSELGAVLSLAVIFSAWLDNPNDVIIDEGCRRDVLLRFDDLERRAREDDDPPCVLDFVQLWIESDPGRIHEIGSNDRLLLLVILIADGWASSGQTRFWGLPFVRGDGGPVRITKLARWADYFQVSEEKDPELVELTLRTHPLLIPGSFEATRSSVVASERSNERSAQETLVAIENKLDALRASGE